MKMNEKLLAQAYEDLKGDLKNTIGGVSSNNKFLVEGFQGSYWCVTNLKGISSEHYICTVEEFNNYSPEKHSSAGERLHETVIQMQSTQEVKSPCKTKQKLHTAKNTITGMEMFLEEVGLLEVWNDNKSEYLGEE